MANKGLKTTDLARKTKLPQPTVHRIVSGITPNPHASSLKPIADFFNVTIEQLKGIKPIAWLKMDSLFKKQLGQINEIPVLMWDEASDWKQALKNTKHDESILTDAAVSDNAYALRMNDHSMEPIFPEGTLLIIDPDKLMTDKCYALIQIDQSKLILFRQIFIDENFQYLRALNDKEEKFAIKTRQPQDRCLGVLTQIKRDF